MPDCTQIYALPRWGEDYFSINDLGHLCVRPDPDSPVNLDLAELTAGIRARGLSLPVLVRFNDILRHRVRRLHAVFDQARAKAGYGAPYTPVYPIKVNQQRSVVEQILRDGRCGLEAGSKPELMAVLALAAGGARVICNGYKDREYVRLALIGKAMGLDLVIVIEKPGELDLVLDEAGRLGIEPVLGVRVRLAAEAAGKWQSSGGEKAKFGLGPAQVLALLERLRNAGCLHWLRLLHAHLGSQIPNLTDIRAGLRELVRYFAELHRLGAALDMIDVGGGLGVDYEGTRSRDFCSINYRLDAYADAVVQAIGGICAEHGLPQPDIITESGRAMTAHHAVLITQVIDREGDEPPNPPPPPESEDPRLGILEALAQETQPQSPLETFDSARDCLNELRAAFESGTLNLPQRARAEDLFLQVCRALRPRLEQGSRRQRELLDRINALLAGKLFCNFSLFQSMPDVWGIEQIFPILPLQRLDQAPDRRAVLHDLTCDSDGCIQRYVDQDGIEASLPVHAARPGEEYLLGFFLVGAYQEILGDMHNLFGDTDAVNVELDGHGGYRLLDAEPGDSVDELLSYVHFEPRAMIGAYRRKLRRAGLDPATRERYFTELKAGLYGYTYLETE